MPTLLRCQRSSLSIRGGLVPDCPWIPKPAAAQVPYIKWRRTKMYTVGPLCPLIPSRGLKIQLVESSGPKGMDSEG